jgi:hypothetical protein
VSRRRVFGHYGFSSAPYLGNERGHHMLELLHAKDEFHETKEEAKDHLKRFL